MTENEQERSLPPRICPICGKQNKQLLFSQRFSTMSSGSLLKGYEVVACLECGFCFAEHIPKQAAFDEYYEKMSKYERQDSESQTSAYELVRFRTAASFIRSVHADREARVLEVGCATAGLLALLKQDGYTHVLGLDPSESCAKAAARMHGIRVVSAKLSDVPLPDESFDLIIMTGVLEHVRDLDQSLNALTKLLAPQGQLYIAVPDASRYVEGDDAPFQEFSVEHINFFGPVSLTNLLARHGFSMAACEQSTILANHRTSTPIIQAAYRKQASVEFRASMVRDIATPVGLKEYINQSRREDERLHRLVDGIVADGQQLIVWGTGSQTLRLLETSRLKEASVCAFVDSNPLYQGKTLHGLPILAPASLSRLAAPILISSRVYQKEIHDQIVNRLKLKNRVITLYELDDDEGS